MTLNSVIALILRFLPNLTDFQADVFVMLHCVITCYFD